MKHKLMLASIVASLAGLPRELEYMSKHPERKCLLPGCNVVTRHNGGYCCAAHHKEHKHGQKTSTH